MPVYMIVGGGRGGFGQPAQGGEEGWHWARTSPRRPPYHHSSGNTFAFHRDTSIYASTYVHPHTQHTYTILQVAGAAEEDETMTQPENHALLVYTLTGVVSERANMWSTCINSQINTTENYISGTPLSSAAIS